MRSRTAVGFSASACFPAQRVQCALLNSTGRGNAQGVQAAAPQIHQPARPPASQTDRQKTHQGCTTAEGYQDRTPCSHVSTCARMQSLCDMRASGMRRGPLPLSSGAPRLRGRPCPSPPGWHAAALFQCHMQNSAAGLRGHLWLRVRCLAPPCLGNASGRHPNEVNPLLILLRMCRPLSHKPP